MDKQLGGNPNVTEIDRKYEKLFSEAGLKIEDYCICRAKRDGACGANCIALLFRYDETLGKYVRNNVNDHIVKFWPFYEPFVTFPFNQKCGTIQKPFLNASEYLNFLQNDKESSLLWMDHHDLQAICKMYQVPLHILTVGVEGMVEPKARWTHLEPDTRLKKFCSINIDLPDVWIFHTDKVDFDLIVSKDSEFAKHGTVNKRQSKPVEKLDANNVNEKEENDSKKSDAVANNQTGEDDEPIEGPGYMGWGIDDKTGEYDKTQDFKSKLEKVKDSYDNLKSEFDELKTAFKQMEKKLEEKNVDAKSIKKLDSEIIKLISN